MSSTRLHRRKGSKYWRFQWTDATGHVRTRTLKGITSFKKACDIRDKVLGDVADEKHGILDVRAKRIADAAQLSIETHIKAWEKYLEAGHEKIYASTQSNVVRRLFVAAVIDCTSGISPAAVRTALGKLDLARGKGDVSNRTRNRGLTACKMFCTYLVKEKKLAENPLEHLEGWHVASDPHHQHVAFTDEEAEAIIEAARKSKRCVGGLTGAQRAMLYELAAGTGFRRRTLWGLTPANLHLHGKEPYIVVIPSNVKNRKEREHPILPELAAKLAAFTKGMAPNETVFKPSRWSDTAAMMRTDLKAAGMDYRVGEHHFRDFHSWRNTFVTNVVRTGGLKVAQDLAGHSTPDLTAKYARPTMRDYRSALEALRKPEAKEGKRTA